MKPIAILQFSPLAAPGYFATYLQSRGVSFELIRIDQGDSVPTQPSTYAGICLLGGDMSVNDHLPWIPKVLDLIRTADRQAVPLIGHCLGGQLMAKAFGGEITRNPVKEIGWGELQRADNPTAHAWVRDHTGQPLEHFTTFQWHGDTFSLPPDAVPLFSSHYCANQGYVIERTDSGGQRFAHLGMQSHMEMTPELVQAWMHQSEPEIVEEIARTGGPAVQFPPQMLENLETRTAALSRVATGLYDCWMKGVV